MSKTIIHTDAAPAAIGVYSQAVNVNGTVYLSGQIPLNPDTMQLVEGIDAQIHQMFKTSVRCAGPQGAALTSW